MSHGRGLLSPGERASRLLARLRHEGVGATLIRGASGSVVAKVIGALVGFAFHLALARTLGDTSYGTYGYAFAWLTLVGGLLHLGFANALVRLVAGFEAEKAWSSLRGALRYAQGLTLSVSLVAMGLGAAALLLAGDDLRPELRRAFAMGLPALPLMAVIALKEAALRGFRRPVLASVPDPIVRPLATLLLLGATITLLGGDLDAADAMGLTVAGFLAALLFGVLAARRISPPEVREAQADVARGREWTWIALPMLLTLAMNTIARRADVLMIGAFLEPSQVAYYTAAIRYADLIVFTQQAVNGMAAPMFASLFAARLQPQLQRVASLAALGTLACALPLSIVMVFFGKPLLALFGETFQAGQPALAWLAIGQLVNGLSGSVGSLAAMTGHHREAAILVTLSTVLNVAMNAVLIPTLGIEGAAIATGASIAFANVAMLVLVRRRLKIDPTVLGLLRKDGGRRAS